MIEENEILNGQIISEDNVDSLLFGDDVLEGKLIASGSVVASMVAQKGAKGDKGDKGDTGATGADGQPGADGYSPSATVSKVGKVATITITDKNGTTTAEIRDGEDGSGTGDMLKSTYDTDNNGIVDNAEKVNNHTVLSDVPSGAVFTDTTYTAGTGINISAQNVISCTQSGGGLEELPIVWGEEEGIADLCSLDNGVYIVPEDEEFATLTASIQRVKAYISSYSIYGYDYDEIKPNDIVFVNLVNYGNNPVTPAEGDSFTIVRGYTIKSIYLSNIKTAAGITNYTWSDVNDIKYIRDVTNTSPSNLFSNDVNVLCVNYTLNYTDTTTQTSKSISLPKGSMVLGKVDDLISLGRNAVTIISSDGKLYKMTDCTVGNTPDATIVEIIPTKTSQLTNDSNFITTSNTAGLIKNDGTIDTTSYSTFSGSYTDLSNKPTIPDELADLNDDSTHRVVTDTEKTAWSGKQDALVSGTNIKTINSTSLLGSGNIDVGASIPVQDTAPLNPSEDDLWIDTSEPEEMQETIQNTYSDSTTDTYSCDYINDNMPVIANYTSQSQEETYSCYYMNNLLSNVVSDNIKIVEQNISVNWSGTGWKTGTFTYTTISGFTCIACFSSGVPSGDVNGIMFNMSGSDKVYYIAYVGYGNSGTMKVRLLFVKNSLIS